MIRMGLVGCGMMASAYLRQMQALADRLVFTALVDIDLDRATRARGSSPVAAQARVASRLEDIFDEVDALVLAVPHDLHAPMAIAALQAGKHVLIEKPIANTEPQCLAVLDAARQTRLVAMHGYVMRYNPLVREFCRLVREQTYGPCFQLSIWTEQFTDTTRGAWVGQADRVGGGQLFSHGCHYIDILLHCLGSPVEGTHVGTNLGTPWMQMEGTSNVSLKFASGATAYHFGTWGARGSRLRYSMHAHCTGGMLEAFYETGDIILWLDPSHGDLGGMSREELADAAARPRSRVIYHTEPGAKHTSEEMAHFVHCIQTGAKPDTDLAAGLQSLRTIWRLYDAERRGIVANLRGLGLDEFNPEPDPVLAAGKRFGYTTNVGELFAP